MRWVGESCSGQVEKSLFFTLDVFMVRVNTTEDAPYLVFLMCSYLMTIGRRDEEEQKKACQISDQHRSSYQDDSCS